ncbi:MAG: EAL domain-containing protein [Pseudomonadota bacterium]
MNIPAAFPVPKPWTMGGSAARPRLKYDRSLICMGIVMLIVMIVVTSVLTLIYLRTQAEARVALTTQNLAKSLVLTFDGILDAVDVALQASSDEIARQNGAARPDGEEIDRFLARQQQRLAGAPALRGADASGAMVYGVAPDAPAVNVADRPYFSALRDAPPVGLYVSPPTISRTSHKWVWSFARRIDNSDASFGGVMLGVLDVEQIERIMAKINLDSGGSIVLRSAGFEAIAGRMGTRAAFPLRVGDTALSPELRAALRNDARRGTYATARSVLSDAAHTFSYERSSKYGFYVWVGEANAIAMVEWQRQVWVITGLTLAFALLAFSFLLLMGRAWRRQARDLDAIEQSQLSLREAQEIADIGSLTYSFHNGSWKSSDIFDAIVGIGEGYPRDLKHLLRFIGRKERIAVQRYVKSAVMIEQPFDSEQMLVRRSDGKRRWVHARGKVCIDAEQVQTLVCTIQDITERKKSEDEIRRLAYYDGLTELPNRRLLRDRVCAVMASSRAYARHGAVLLIDLDDFKTLNDTKGHDKGDLLLKAVGRRLLDCMRETDTVARLGGDEFVVLVGDLPGDPGEARRHAAAVGEKLRAALSRPFDLDGYQYAGTPSVGISLFSGEELSLDELAKRADTAMYQAKAAGRNTVRFFDPDMQAAAAARVALETDLRQAIAEQQFQLHYQVQIDAAGRPTGAEVLLRWVHPVRGMVSPAQFIPLAEASGLILPLGQWVLETACAQLAAWAGDPFAGNLSLAVNVSACQFDQPEFIDLVLAALDRSGANPHLLKLELTEGSLLENTDAMIATMSALKRAGVGFSLDDFGTGYSSLSYLKRLPLDQLKIDQSFVRDLLTDANDVAIVRTIVALGQSLGMDVIAEGVETDAQRACLEAAGCHAFQGYLFGRPLPLACFEQSLRGPA